MNELKELTDLIIEFRNQRNWKQFHTPKDMIISLNLEAAELLELTQWKNDQELREYLSNNPEELSDELADILYWLLLIAKDLNIDLKETFLKKMSKNNEKYPIDKAKNSAKKYKSLS